MIIRTQISNQIFCLIHDWFPSYSCERRSCRQLSSKSLGKRGLDINLLFSLSYHHLIIINKTPSWFININTHNQQSLINIWLITERESTGTFSACTILQCRARQPLKSPLAGTAGQVRPKIRLPSKKIGCPTNQCLGQDVGSECPKLAVLKLWGIKFWGNYNELRFIQPLTYA